MIKVS